MKNEKYIIKAKPLSVNRLYTGRRYKTPEYKVYFDELFYKLPPVVEFDRGSELEVTLRVGLSNRRQDLDNVAKAILDVMQKKYDFDDCHVKRLIMEKDLTPKGEEFISFNIINIE